MAHTYSTLQAILLEIRLLAERYFRNGDECARRSGAHKILESVLGLLGCIAERYGQNNQQNDVLNQHLDIAMVAMEAVYKVTGNSTGLRDLNASLLDQAATLMSGNKWFVQHIVDEFLIDLCAHKYEQSIQRNRVINDLLFDHSAFNQHD